MIKENQKRLNNLAVLLDALVAVVSYLAAYLLVFRFQVFSTFIGPALPVYSFRGYMSALLFLAPALLCAYWVLRLYTPKRVTQSAKEISSIIQANLIVLLVFSLILFLGKERLQHFSRPMLALFFVLNTTGDVLFRYSVRRVLRLFRRKGYNQKHVLLVGCSRAAFSYIDRTMENPVWGYKIRGILDDDTDWGYEYRGIHVIGATSELDDILSVNRLDEIVITLGLREYDKLEHIVAVCEKSGVHTKFVPDYNNIIPTRPYTEDLQGLPVIHIRHVPLTDSFNATIKRGMDLVGGVTCLILFSPVMLLTALMVKCSSPGPVIFRQERVGLHNRAFAMYKFRSMRVQAPNEEKKEWTKAGDNRVTKIGRLIRKLSIDELPQLFNVIKGDMSLVGPRPERPFFVEKFREEIPRYMIKHQVRPGMTGWAQVNGYRGDTSIRRRIDCDLYYIENWTVGFDIKIMLMTVVHGFINKNAY
ncbi:MAG: undecaprenyl-phosphate glucose phosphotransferase [Lachnospiraceae bacterium]|nr:undecaprenyl-phosphate glucose phosphotransferase [Lachnospiraceae bacterium]